ncbi:hypothetical protein GJT93_01120 [Enterobacteriaceae endosymbiont of Donacia provostii]|nr:hypothetical protein [Enterobacteriaceae endosymbiont of Donacia provostii]QJC33706.1 hypothetical protein GJT93_01120 [Enterobacteriaceae endosymbiont of Donacia provostii]
MNNFIRILINNFLKLIPINNFFPSIFKILSLIIKLDLATGDLGII